VTDELDGLALAAALAGLPAGACGGLQNVDCTDDAGIPDLLLILKSVAHLPVQVPQDCATVGS
jgi:hypothetical protein